MRLVFFLSHFQVLARSTLLFDRVGRRTCILFGDVGRTKTSEEHIRTRPTRRDPSQDTFLILFESSWQGFWCDPRGWHTERHTQINSVQICMLRRYLYVYIYIYYTCFGSTMGVVLVGHTCGPAIPQVTYITCNMIFLVCTSHDIWVVFPLFFSTLGTSCLVVSIIPVGQKILFEIQCDFSACHPLLWFSFFIDFQCFFWYTKGNVWCFQVAACCTAPWI